MKQHSKLAAIGLVIVLTACDGLLATFRTGLATSRPLADSLVASGAITQKQADVVVADFDAGVKCGETLQADFKAIPKDLSKHEIRARKLEASQKAYQCFRVIVERHNFALHPRFQKAANIADGILASLVIFYSDGTTAVSPDSSVFVVRDEGELGQELKVRMKALKQAMQP